MNLLHINIISSNNKTSTHPFLFSASCNVPLLLHPVVSTGLTTLWYLRLGVKNDLLPTSSPITPTTKRNYGESFEKYMYRTYLPIFKF